MKKSFLSRPSAANIQSIMKEFLNAYEAYAEPIFRHCFFRVYSRARAEELMQEVFLRLWQYLSDGKRVENPRAFLYKVANNLVIDESRKRKEGSLEEIMAEPNVFEPSSDEHQKMERQALFKEVVSTVNELPPGYREVLIMRYIDDLDPREIAAVLGISVNNVSVRLNRAVKALKSKMK